LKDNESLDYSISKSKTLEKATSKGAPKDKHQLKNSSVIANLDYIFDIYVVI
jgi:hypothetical protein